MVLLEIHFTPLNRYTCTYICQLISIYSYLAPSTPPLNISIESLNSSAIRVDWEPPKPIHHNGIITEYEIQYYEMHQNITLKIINNSANKLFEVMTNLDSNVSYCVAIRVATIAGVSERSSPVCTFTGMYYVLFFNYLT